MLIALTVAGAWLGLSLGGRTSAEVGPLGVDVRVHPVLTGDAVLDLPPLGTLSVDSHDGPAGLLLSVRGIDIASARSYVENPERVSSLDVEIESDLSAAVRRAALRGLLVGVAGAALFVMLALRSWRSALAAAGLSASLIGSSFAAAGATFNPDALQEPEFSGLISAAPGLLENVQTIAKNVTAYGEQLGRIVSNASALYQTTLALPGFTPDADTIRILHVSDLHLNPAAWQIIKAVADQYDVDVIADTGDIADQGAAIEARYVSGVGELGRPYVYARGNHDSVLIESAIADLPNAIVMDGTVVEVAGVRFLGLPDPRFTPDLTAREKGEAQIAQAWQQLRELSLGADPPADVVMFHDPTHAAELDGAARLLLSGHGHRRRTELYPEGLRVMVEGSTGGAGLRALEHEKPTPVTLTVLYLDRPTRTLQAWDEITLGGLGESVATVKRVQAADVGSSPEESPQESPLESPLESPQQSPTGDPATVRLTPTPTATGSPLPAGVAAP